MPPSNPPPAPYSHLYDPPPCSAWPAEVLRVVGSTYRDAAGRGLDTVECLNLTRAAYLRAGGTREGADQTIAHMVASLSRERGDWLWGPMDAWWARERPDPVPGSPLHEEGEGWR